MKKAVLIFAALILTATAAHAQNNEFAPIVEKTVNYKHWTLNDLVTNKPVSLRSLMNGKKLVMVLYFAPWCPNWRNEAPVAARLYDKYKSQGFEIVAVSEYAPAAESKTYFGPNGAPYPVVVESELREDRDKTAHYAYRQLTGDTRKWGSPWNIFLDPAKCNSSGDLLTEKAFVVNGELIEAEVDKFIADRLKTNAAITPCKP
ncbi:MAG TPA: TlpA disulfide reductase family protein [Pyrinomonadaceae bacterium]|nr:TlpA disulfide reductase family protein [Pyrinomonadaceae bacterium]